MVKMNTFTQVLSRFPEVGFLSDWNNVSSILGAVYRLSMMEEYHVVFPGHCGRMPAFHNQLTQHGDTPRVWDDLGTQEPCVAVPFHLQ